MPASITVTVRIVDGHAVRDAAIVVSHGCPVGAAWSSLADPPGPDPPAGVVYVLNGVRTLPSAWMAEGDRLDIRLPGPA